MIRTMKNFQVALVLLALTGGVLVMVPMACSRRGPVQVVSATAAATVLVTSFDTLSIGAEPAGFYCSAPGPEGVKPARWRVVSATDAPSAPAVLEQGDGDDRNHRYPVALLSTTQPADVRVSVRAQALSGARDRSFGVVVRAQDDRNYYVARANTSEWGHNIRFYKFVDGVRRQLPGEWEGSIPPGQWHTLRIDAVGEHFTIYLNDHPVLSAVDQQFPGPGLIGVWTKAESISRFDDLTVTPLQR